MTPVQEWRICESLNEDSLDDLSVIEADEDLFIEVNGERCKIDADDALTMCAVIRSCVKRTERRRAIRKGALLGE